MSVVLINFSRHPFTQMHLEQMESLLGRPVERVIDVPGQFDDQQPFAQQTRALVDKIGFDSTTWQTTPVVVNLPTFPAIAATVLADLHGRMGHFPTIIRMRQIVGVLTEFEVAEIINLQDVRDHARLSRAEEDG